MLKSTRDINLKLQILIGKILGKDYLAIGGLDCGYKVYWPDCGEGIVFKDTTTKNGYVKILWLSTGSVTIRPIEDLLIYMIIGIEPTLNDVLSAIRLVRRDKTHLLNGVKPYRRRIATYFRLDGTFFHWHSFEGESLHVVESDFVTYDLSNSLFSQSKEVKRFIIESIK